MPPVDLLQINDFLDGATRADLLAQMCSASGAPATVYANQAGSVELRMRKVTRLIVSPETSACVVRHLIEKKNAIEAYFGRTLEHCEDPQFLHYRTGDYFVAHQDGNTPIVRDASLHRKVSVVIFLNPQTAEPTPGTYGGGELVFHGPYSALDFRLPVAADPGTLVAFRAETTHEVVPVTHGERFTIVSWFR